MVANFKSLVKRSTHLHQLWPTSIRISTSMFLLVYCDRIKFCPTDNEILGAGKIPMAPGKFPSQNFCTAGTPVPAEIQFYLIFDFNSAYNWLDPP